jgi:hypothetical protein
MRWYFTIARYWLRRSNMLKQDDSRTIILNRQKLFFMITADKMKPDITTYWFVLVLLFVIVGIYGRQALEWALMKLYEFFIQRGG